MTTKLFRIAVVGTMLTACTGLTANAAGPGRAPATVAAVNTTGMFASGQSLKTDDLLTSPSEQHALWVGPSLDNEAFGLTSETCTTQVWGPVPAGATTAQLVMQTDGNLVVYSGGQAAWNSGTWGNPGAWFAVQDDMNLVVYSATGKPLWNSGTSCTNAFNYDTVIGDPYVSTMVEGDYMQSPDRRYKFILQTDGNLVLYGPSGRALWAARTNSSTANTMSLELNGNLRVHSGTTTRWQTRTGKTPPSGQQPEVVQLSVQNDGNVVLYRWVGQTPVPLWSTGTSGRS